LAAFAYGVPLLAANFFDFDRAFRRDSRLVGSRVALRLWLPELSIARRRSERRRLHDDLLRPDPTGGGEAGQLDSDDA
jgi:hypothetical protein